MRQTVVWTQAALAAYVVLLLAVPLGEWNAAGDDALVPSLLRNHTVHLGDALQALFPVIPLLILTWRRSAHYLIALVSVILFDLVWATMHYLSWWAPYLTGHAKSWQIAYAHGPTTKVLLQIGGHIPPDGMHLSIDLLLFTALLAASAALKFQLSRRKAAREASKAVR